MARYFSVINLSPQNSKDYVEHFPSEEDESGDPRYYGLLSHTGSWIIVEHHNANGTFRYLVGKTLVTYKAAWIARAGGTYSYLSEIYGN